MPARKTTEQFISDSRNKFGDKFLYENTKYLNKNTEVVITCPEHGDIKIKPAAHLRSTNGCLECKPKIKGRPAKSCEQFILDSKAKFGDKFDYRLVEYINNKTPVIIICPDHGEIQQVPADHLKSVFGCRYCAPKGVLLTQEQFIEKASAVHEGKYDYSESVYIAHKYPIDIICPVHGKFTQSSAGNHLCGRGCPKCPRTTAVTTQMWVDRAVFIHGERYDYSETDYTHSDQKLRIICRDHGEFYQLPSHHTNGSHCPKCALRYTPTTEEFVEKCRVMHGDRYDYGKTVFKGAKEYIVYECAVHGEVEQQAYDHMSGHGCGWCAGVRTYSTEQWVAMAKHVHSDYYDYSKANYTTKGEKVVIICPVHGEFTQQAGSHIRGVGCSGCASHGYDRMKKGTLYVLRAVGYENDIVKIGISNDLKRRIGALRNNTPFDFECIEIFEFDDGNIPFAMESDAHSYAKENQLEVEFPDFFDGYREWFRFCPNLLDLVRNSAGVAELTHLCSDKC
ncbi:GIY-YIG nuclease family protein [Vibrio breoganii]